MKLEETFMNFLLRHQLKHSRTLNFLILMESILTAARYIQKHFSNTALNGTSGAAGVRNVQGEDVMQMDLMAHQIVMHYLRESNQVIEATSEEVSDEIRLNADGRYFLYFDPLDGSSNIKHSLPVGFLFAIAKRNLDGVEDYHLRSGKEFIASGIFTIPTGIFTFALKNSGAWRFYLDDSGDYIRPTRIILPENQQSWELSWNSGNFNFFNNKVQDWIAKNQGDFNFRYSGSLAVDFHRLLLNGGMYFYPAITQHKDPGKNRPAGKLRLLYETAVIAYIAREAGGAAVDENGTPILDIVPTHRHQRSALYVGNKSIISDIRKMLVTTG
jgi:fructose-1,6-bisphosphatase I